MSRRSTVVAARAGRARPAARRGLRLQRPRRRPSASGGAGVLTVSSTADACDVSAAEVDSGTVTFAVTNEGDDVTEFYLLGEDGLRVVAEVENVGPGLSRDLVVQVRPGTYYTACKPGMVGDGIRAEFTVTDSGAEVGPDG